MTSEEVIFAGIGELIVWVHDEAVGLPWPGTTCTAASEYDTTDDGPGTILLSCPRGGGLVTVQAGGHDYDVCAENFRGVALPRASTDPTRQHPFDPVAAA